MQILQGMAGIPTIRFLKSTTSVPGDRGSYFQLRLRDPTGER
ncbi:unnamed protein product [Tuwongella immobilis]|uniref:Uncharacterized protein n=1 Tax=Tuwongella immobilis TaxID=692036 RepID=A0A6C2YQG3_9BACT|nr:unnamed protein product [Tuwongella immobilis]VTS04636.1 unnamed protein product [Tuwongella immobilis]